MPHTDNLSSCRSRTSHHFICNSPAGEQVDWDVLKLTGHIHTEDAGIGNEPKVRDTTAREWCQGSGCDVRRLLSRARRIPRRALHDSLHHARLPTQSTSSIHGHLDMCIAFLRGFAKRLQNRPRKTGSQRKLSNDVVGNFVWSSFHTRWAVGEGCQDFVQKLWCEGGGREVSDSFLV